MNINNIKNLLSAYFIENGRRDLINILLMNAIITFFIVIIGGGLQAAFYIAFFLVTFYASRMFWHLGKSSANIHYLMLPANTMDKIATNFLIVNISYVAQALVGVIAGYSAAFLAIKLFMGSNISIAYSSAFAGFGFGEYILTLYTVLAIFFFGSIYFKKRALGKTFLSIMAIMFAFAFVMFFTLWLNFKITIPDFQGIFQTSFNFPSNGRNGISDGWKYAGCAFTIIYCYVLSFIRLRETEA